MNDGDFIFPIYILEYIRTGEIKNMYFNLFDDLTKNKVENLFCDNKWKYLFNLKLLNK